MIPERKWDRRVQRKGKHEGTGGVGIEASKQLALHFTAMGSLILMMGLNG